MDSPFPTRAESFVELSPRERLTALLDAGFTELLDPFCRVASPWLERQGLIAQADDGVIAVQGTIDSTALIAVAIEPAFEGGSIGEVGGAKIATALRLAAESCREGRPMAALLLLESGGVRLGEANLGLAAIASIQAAIIDLRELAPVVVVIAGPTGCFGGMSLAAALCTEIIGTMHGRLGMNGPEVIEQEAGPAELDATDREQIWQMVGCEARLRDGYIDRLAGDTAASIGDAVREALHAGPHAVGRIAGASTRLATLRREVLPDRPAATQAAPQSRARRWMELLAGAHVQSVSGTPSVLCAEAALDEGEPVLMLAIAPDPDSRLPRAAHGEMGLEQAWALAACIRAWTAEQAESGPGRAIIAIVDTPGQAFGRVEETRCISAACAALVDAYAAARRAGYPVVALVVGRAISGSFLAHGLQSDRILALDAPGVMMHAMSRESIARITRRTVAEVEAAAEAVAPMSYSILQAHALGIIHTIMRIENADAPNTNDRATVRSALLEALRQIDAGEPAPSIDGNPLRAATLAVRRQMREQWQGLAASSEKEHEHDASHQ